MDKPDLFEPDWQVFTGTVIRWDATYGELLTDSGVTIALVTQGHPEIPKGSRTTIKVRKYRPLYGVAQVLRTEPAR